MRLIIVLILAVFCTSCGSHLKSTEGRISTTDRIINQANAFEGVPYKFGGTTRAGMDCSGLVYVAFGNENISLPRVSRFMAKEGFAISNNRIKKGDLVFFKTSKKSRHRINHVGLVTKVEKGVVYFIHATTSRGVLTSSLDEKYWRRAYVTARRVI